jgi:aspartate racemase
MIARRPGDVLGVVGGLGPLASAEFVRTIYEYAVGGPEQAMPTVILSSDPSVPDRTTAFQNGTQDHLRDRLRGSIQQLVQLRCTRIVICCVTMHGVLEDLEPDLRAPVTSLIDVAIDDVRARGERQLLCCSSGTRERRVFQRHRAWASIEPLVVLPDAGDQAAIHTMIYDIKRTDNTHAALPAVGALLEKYRVGSLIAGCTEIHLLTKLIKRTGAPWRCCDPLDTIARDWARGG